MSRSSPLPPTPPSTLHARLTLLTGLGLGSWALPTTTTQQQQQPALEDEGKAMTWISTYATGIDCNNAQAVGLYAELLWLYVRRQGPALPARLRLDLVEDCEDFMSSPLVKDKSLVDKMQFLARKGVTVAEMYQAMRSLHVHVTEEELRRGRRVVNPDKIEAAVTFMRSEQIKDRSLAERITFLKEKQLTEDELQETLDLCADVVQGLMHSSTSIPSPTTTPLPTTPLPSTPPPSFAIAFLSDPKIVAGHTEDELKSFLRTKGLTEEQIQLAWIESQTARNATIPVSKPTSNVQQAVSFLSNPAVSSKSLREKITFLQSRGISDVDIRAACQAVGLSPTPADMMTTTTTNTSPTAIAKAVTFLTNPSVQNQSMSEKIAFLKNRGLSEADIRAACTKAGLMYVEGVTSNRTVAAASSSLPTFSLTDTVASVLALVREGPDRLTSSPSSSDALNAYVGICVFLTACLRSSTSSSQTALPPNLASKVATFLHNLSLPRPATAATTTNNHHADISPVHEALACEMFELTATLDELCKRNKLLLSALQITSGTPSWSMFRSALSIFPSSLTAQLTMARCIHGHFSSRASMEIFFLSRLLKSINEHLVDSKQSAMCRAALLRGGDDFGWGLLIPDEFDSIGVDVTLQLIEIATQHANAYTGFACVYANLAPQEALLPALCNALFDGCLCLDGITTTTNSNQIELDDMARVATRLVDQPTFQLAAHVSKYVIDSSSSSKQAKINVVNHAHKFTVDVHNGCRAQPGIANILAKRMLERAYDNKAASLPLRDTLGEHADLAKLFQTVFLVVMVLCDKCTTPDYVQGTGDVDTFMTSWDSLAKLGFALVPTADGIKFHELIKSAIAMEDVGSPSWRFISRTLLNELATTSNGTIDWICAAHIEYILTTGAKFLVEDPQVWAQCTHDDVEALILAQVFLLGIGHSFSFLNRRSHDVITRCFELDLRRRDDNIPLMQMAMVPAYWQGAVRSCPMATPADLLAFGLANSLIGLRRNPDPRAQDVACVAFGRAETQVKEVLFGKGKELNRATVLVNMLFLMLRAASLTSLPVFLDKVNHLLLTVAFKEGVKDEPSMISLDKMKEMVFNVIAKTEDAGRRALLAVWYVEKVRDLNDKGVVAKL